MKVVFHDNFLQTYVRDPAASAGRLDHALAGVKKRYPLVTPRPCSDDDVLIVHTRNHLEDVKMEEHVYSMALLAAGATIKASELAMEGEFSFALCRPPGHHASPNHCWGFCYFNNVAIAVQKLIQDERIGSALIIDYDLHFGDGTSNIFTNNSKVEYRHINGANRASFIKNLEECLDSISADLVAVSAGYDRHQADWGHLLATEDYETMGAMLGAYALKNCNGRLFAALEGGYNSKSLGDSVVAFLEGLESSKLSKLE